MKDSWKDVSLSEYQNKFVIKGGMLIAGIVGLDTRATMDLDTTLRELPLSEKKIIECIKNICMIGLKDEVSFNIISVSAIRKDDPDAQTKIEDVPLSLATNSGNIVRSGYAFVGWNTLANGEGTDYSPGADYTANAAVTLYAKWSSNLVTNGDFSLGNMGFTSSYMYTPGHDRCKHDHGHGPRQHH